ncbi:MAG TPA: hypothetical protein VKH35_04785, partial [Thermoanaerobaculia bacterium]|nr:hypothetical protein [Thermoanaerobaculia bacterium]
MRRRKKGTTYRVKRLEGLLNATFMNKDVAHLQDDLWGRWGAAIPRLADRKPTLPVTLRAELISKETPALTDELLAKLLSYQPAAGVVRSADSSGAVTAGEYIADVFFDVWKNGKMPGGRRREKPEKTWKEMERALNKIVYELEYAYDDDGEKLRDDDGNVVAHWGSAAFAHHVLDEVTAETVFALDQRVSDLGIGLEVWRKVRSFLRQMFAYARLDKDSGFALERANPVDDVPPPAVEKRPRRAYLPDVVEGIRADFYYVAVLSNAGIRRVRGGPRIWTPGDVPIPADPEYALDSADRVEAGAYAGLRPSELFGAHGCAYRRAAPLHLRIDERHVGNDHKSGTKSRSYPEKHVLMLGTLPAMIAERAGSAGADGILFPYPGTDRYFTKDEYKNWR